jgi:hypothetical protein
MSDWRSLLAGAAIVFALVVALLSTLLAARWVLRDRGDDGVTPPPEEPAAPRRGGDAGIDLYWDRWE